MEHSSYNPETGRRTLTDFFGWSGAMGSPLMCLLDSVRCWLARLHPSFPVCSAPWVFLRSESPVCCLLGVWARCSSTAGEKKSIEVDGDYLHNGRFQNQHSKPDWIGMQGDWALMLLPLVPAVINHVMLGPCGLGYAAIAVFLMRGMESLSCDMSYGIAMSDDATDILVLAAVSMHSACSSSLEI
ncbi:hypothetical protein Nepgr_002787 [Nepenthes gracilis]|uniref:Uncharacterized protein n=1 Tax=Nepenthes gracilis TaxID=150966 RepID=A0AAD3RYG2_NEPGR|nr:hypothetical protein Nepgr_002787 [Nepenthes gracilis]